MVWRFGFAFELVLDHKSETTYAPNHRPTKNEADLLAALTAFGTNLLQARFRALARAPCCCRPPKRPSSRDPLHLTVQHDGRVSSCFLVCVRARESCCVVFCGASTLVGYLLWLAEGFYHVNVVLCCFGATWLFVQWPSPNQHTSKMRQALFHALSTQQVLDPDPGRNRRMTLLAGLP